MNYILFDDTSWENLIPLTFTRPIADIRIGILTIREKWEKHLKTQVSFKTQEYLSEKFLLKIENDNCFINGSIIPTKELIEKMISLKIGEVLKQKNTVIACKLSKSEAVKFSFTNITELKSVEFEGEIIKIDAPHQIFSLNEKAIELDFKLLTEGRKSQKLSKTNNLLCEENIFVEEGVQAEFVTINAKNSFVYLGKDSEIMEGAVVRGSLALCEHSTLKIGAKIYGATTIGPHSKVGGEVSNAVIFGFSNKGHDGFIGNTVLGEWCNLGADTNTSNLKNNYAPVRLWNYKSKNVAKTGLQFCGLIMGDHSKCGINTMFNTGTVVGVNANIYGSGFPRNFVPDFSWGGSAGFQVYGMDKALEVAQIVMHRRGVDLTDIDKKIMQHIFEITEEYRNF